MYPQVYFRSLHNYLASTPEPDMMVLWDNFGIGQSASFLVGTGRLGFNPIVHDLYKPKERMPGIDFFEHKQLPVVLGLADNSADLHPVLPWTEGAYGHRRKWVRDYQLYIGLKARGKTDAIRAKHTAQSTLELGLEMAKNQIPFCMPHNAHTAFGRFSRIVYFDPELRTYNGTSPDFTRYPAPGSLPQSGIFDVIETSFKKIE